MRLFVFVSPLLFAAALPAADSQIAPALNGFTLDSYKRLSGNDGNLILSPFNIAAAISMTLAGARGKTAEEIRTVLHLRYAPAYDVALGALLSDLKKAGNTGGNKLLTANALWLQKGFTILPEFQNALAKYHQAQPMSVDFAGAAESARSRINSWTEEQTKNRIKDLLPPGSLDARTRLVLTGAIYFFGKWQAPFLTSRTQPAPFALASGTTTQADFMNQTSHFGYAEMPSCQILEMRYDGNGTAFDVLLPKTLDGLPDLEKSLTPERLTGWLGSVSRRKVQVSLPKFRAESEFSVGGTLSAMGMPTAFTDQADFSGIAPGRGLAISRVAHKSIVDVSERGTEAAAASGVAASFIALRVPEQPVIFRADHPFVFLIRDTRSGAILFIGRLANPR